MSGRRVGGRFVTHSEAEIYQRALVAPAVNWKQEWVTPAGLSSDSKYKVRKWVKSSTPQEFSDESDQEEVQELYANNSAPTMALPPKPVVAGAPAPRPDDAAVAAAVSAEAAGAGEVKPEQTATTMEVKLSGSEDAEMAAPAEESSTPAGGEEAKPPSAAAVAEPTELAAAAPMLLPSLIPEPAANVNLAPPPSTAAVSSAAAPAPSSPLSPAASSPAAPSAASAAAAAAEVASESTLPSSSSSTLSMPPPPPPPPASALSVSALAGQEDLTALPGQAHPLPGVEGEMALVGEDGSDPRSEGARIGMGAPAAGPEPMDQDEQPSR